MAIIPAPKSIPANHQLEKSCLFDLHFGQSCQVDRSLSSEPDVNGQVPGGVG